MSLLGASGAAAAVGPAFSCQSEIDFLTQSHADGEATKYYESIFKSGEVEYVERNSKSASSSYNALGYDPTNNYLYSTQLNVSPLGTGTVGTLFQIDNTGTRRPWGSSQAIRPKAAGLRTAPSTRPGTTGSPTATAPRKPTRSTSPARRPK